MQTGDRAILKLFDRRYPSELYEMYINQPYSVEYEEKYIQHLLQSPPTAEEAAIDWWELDNLIPADKTDVEPPAGAAKSRDSLGIPGGNGVLTDSQNMRLIANRCISMARAEKAVYQRLRPLQEAGRIPKFYASVEVVVDHVPTHSTIDASRGVQPLASVCTSPWLPHRIRSRLPAFCRRYSPDEKGAS